MCRDQNSLVQRNVNVYYLYMWMCVEENVYVDYVMLFNLAIRRVDRSRHKNKAKKQQKIDWYSSDCKAPLQSFLKYHGLQNQKKKKQIIVHATTSDIKDFYSTNERTRKKNDATEWRRTNKLWVLLRYVQSDLHARRKNKKTKNKHAQMFREFDTSAKMNKRTNVRKI